MKIRAIPIFFLLLLIPSLSNASGKGPRLPEPMVFDLVLPLGAKRNEYEFNALTQYNFEEDAVELNPEFEYAYADGYGIEVEFPMENSNLEAYKLALQGTFSFLTNRKFIHGWQYIGEYHKHDKAFENDLLYLFGYEFNEKWSMLNMTGFRTTDARARGRYEGLVNANLFYTFSKNLIVGLEINWEKRPHEPDITLLMPQFHVQLAKHAKIQFGFGMKRSHHENFPHAASRIIFGF
jgi:hypothetical protein